MPPAVNSVLDISNAAGSAAIAEYRGSGATVSPPYVLSPIKNWLTSRLSALGIAPTTVQQLVNELDAYVMTIPVPTTQLLAASTQSGLALHATALGPDQAELVLSCALENLATGRAYNTRQQIILDAASVGKLNNFAWFLQTLIET